MNTGLRTSLCAGLFQAIVVSTLCLVPIASTAQSTIYGSGALSNNAQYEDNLAFGYQALFNSGGLYNIAMGAWALFSNTMGDQNIGIGYQTLYSNTTGFANTANGFAALYFNTTGGYNTAIGADALESNSTGGANVAVGVGALGANTTGYDNIANGWNTLRSNSTGYANTANGVMALYSNTTGYNNTADGILALYDNTTGHYNIALGYGAGDSLTTGSNNIDIGNYGVARESGVIRIGTKGTHRATFIAGIDGVTSGRGVAVYVNANGQLGTLTSSRRFKKDIHDMGRVSDKLMQLRPVTFRYKEAAEDGTHPVQYGLIAEEVAKVYPDLVQYDKAGKPYTIYYHLLTPMLLNELQKEHRQNVAMKSAVSAQNARIIALAIAHDTDKAEIASLKTQLAEVRQAQQQQLAALTKLTALVQTAQNQAQTQRAVYAH